MTTTYVKHTFRQNAMDLNPDLVAKVDEQIAFELDTMDDLDIARHWIFHDKMYHRAMVNLIIAVRRVQIALKVPATLTDMQIAGKLIRSAGLWELPRPKTISSDARPRARRSCNLNAVVRQQAKRDQIDFVIGMQVERRVVVTAPSQMPTKIWQR